MKINSEENVTIDLSEYDIFPKNKISTDLSIAIVVSNFNSFITHKLLEGALKTLGELGFKKDNISMHFCPGAFEIPFACQTIFEDKFADGIIALSCIIRGDTPHFDYVSKAVTDGILRVSLDYKKPIAFGVLTTDTLDQAKSRCSANDNKGTDAALTLVEMLRFRKG